MRGRQRPIRGRYRFIGLTSAMTHQPQRRCESWRWFSLGNVAPTECQPILKDPMKFTPAKPPLTGETLETLTARLAERGEPAFRAKQILDWLYKKRVRSWDGMSNLSKPLRAWLDETF